jgi:hypothetical protein
LTVHRGLILKDTPTVVDIFCGCGGLSQGFKKAGFEVLLGIDHNPWAIATYNRHHNNLGRESTADKFPEPHYSKPLNKNMLAMRLKPGFKPGEKDNTPPPPIAILYTFWEHLSDLLDTALYPSEDGQIRTSQEKAQTIELYTYTIDFAPKPEKKNRPIKEARLTVKEYFDEAEKE